MRPILSGGVNGVNRRPQSSWPPPPPVLRVLAAARLRYHRTPQTSRPSLSQPHNAITLFPRGDQEILMRSNYWPLSERAIRFLGRTPAERRRSRGRFERRVAEVVREVLAADLPAAVAFLLRRRPGA